MEPIRMNENIIKSVASSKLPAGLKKPAMKGISNPVKEASIDLLDQLCQNSSLPLSMEKTAFHIAYNPLFRMGGGVVGGVGGYQAARNDGRGVGTAMALGGAGALGGQLVGRGIGRMAKLHSAAGEADKVIGGLYGARDAAKAEVDRTAHPFKHFLKEKGNLIGKGDSFGEKVTNTIEGFKGKLFEAHHDILGHEGGSKYYGPEYKNYEQSAKSSHPAAQEAHRKAEADVAAHEHNEAGGVGRTRERLIRHFAGGGGDVSKAMGAAPVPAPAKQSIWTRPISF